MKKYLILLILTSIANHSLAAASVSTESVSSVSTEGSTGWDMVAEHQKKDSTELGELVKENIGKIHVAKNSSVAFNQINKLLVERNSIGEATFARTATGGASDIEDASLVVIYFDGSDEAKTLLEETAAVLKSGKTLMVICKKHMNSEKKLRTPEGLERKKTIKRFYGLSGAPEQRHIVLFGTTV